MTTIPVAANSRHTGPNARAQVAPEPLGHVDEETDDGIRGYASTFGAAIAAEAAFANAEVPTRGEEADRACLWPGEDEHRPCDWLDRAIKKG